MRAEAQAHIDQINAATALLCRFLDWDRANKRLQELNAKVEESSLWDNPKAAQEAKMAWVPGAFQFVGVPPIFS